VSACPVCCVDEVETVTNAHIVGYELAMAERLERDIEDAVQARLHQRWLDTRQVAYREALDNHGPEWAELIWQAAT